MTKNPRRNTTGNEIFSLIHSILIYFVGQNIIVSLICWIITVEEASRISLHFMVRKRFPEGWHISCAHFHREVTQARAQSWSSTHARKKYRASEFIFARCTCTCLWLKSSFTVARYVRVSPRMNSKDMQSARKNSVSYNSTRSNFRFP